MTFMEKAQRHMHLRLHGNEYDIEFGVALRGYSLDTRTRNTRNNSRIETQVENETV